MSFGEPFDTLIAERKLREYRHSNPAAAAVPGRPVLYLVPIVPYINLAAKLPASTRVTQSDEVVVSVIAKLDSLLTTPRVEVCEGVRGTPPSCVVKRLEDYDAAHSETWELRAPPPDYVRLFGCFVRSNTLLLTHGVDHPKSKAEWFEAMDRSRKIRILFGITGDLVYRAASIHDYFR